MLAFGFGFGGLFEGAEVLGGGHVDFLAGEEVLDGEELEAGVFGVGDGFGLEEVGFGVRAQHVVGLKDS